MSRESFRVPFAQSIGDEGERVMTDILGTQAERFHPSIFIEEEMQARGMSLHDLVFRMRRYESEREWGIECLAVEMYLTVHEKNVILTRNMAEGFGAAFGVSPEMFINLHRAWGGALEQSGEATNG
jgi:plasmid maintenance system antidote protein VapI